jgi:hypothetical protein
VSHPSALQNLLHRLGATLTNLDSKPHFTRDDFAVRILDTAQIDHPCASRLYLT